MTPLLTVINFSGGGQSGMLVEEILRGEAPEPTNCVVLNADPGAENSHTYKYQEEIKQRCLKAGIFYETVDGPDLAEDIVQLTVKSKRIDNPPYWVVRPDGKIGRLLQECTGAYKIAPMDRMIRKLITALHPHISVNSRRIPGIVEKWIGFTADETGRMSEPSQKYVRFRYPLIERGITKVGVEEWYAARGLKKPPRSLCNFCFAHGLASLKDMHDNRPDDWAQAVTADKVVRRGIPGVVGTVYVSATCLPLETLAAQDFKLTVSQAEAIRNKQGPDQETMFLDPAKRVANEGMDDSTDWSCDSGHCFL